MAREAFAVMREGMKGKAGIGKLALYGREYLVAVQPQEKGLVMYTMRHAKEVRSMDNIEELDGVPSKVKPDEIKLAKQVIGNFEGKLDLAEYKDDYQEELQRIIDAKIAGEEVVAPDEEAPPKVVNLMDALRQSLDRVSTKRRSRPRPTSRRRSRRSPHPKRRGRKSAPAGSASPANRSTIPLGLLGIGLSSMTRPFCVGALAILAVFAAAGAAPVRKRSPARRLCSRTFPMPPGCRLSSTSTPRPRRTWSRPWPEGWPYSTTTATACPTSSSPTARHCLRFERNRRRTGIGCSATSADCDSRM